MSLLITKSKTIEEKENEEKEKENEEKEKKGKNTKDKKDDKKKYFVKEVRKFFQKIYFIFIIQYAWILFFGLLGFYFGINEIFTQNLTSILLTFIPTTLLSLIIGYHAYINDARKSFNKQIYYGTLTIYIPIIVFYCFLLSKYIDKNYISCGIILFFTDIFCSTFYYIIFKIYRGFIILIISSIFNAITIVLYCKFFLMK